MSTRFEISDQQKITTALITLASDIGSIHNIINASDNNSVIFTQTEKLCKEANTLAYNAEKGIFDVTEIKNVLENISKLANTIYRRKEINPLISDDLIGIIKKTVMDAENVVKLTTPIAS